LEPYPRKRIAAIREDSAITYFRSLSVAGFAATAISYGPARMGFGLFVPEFRSAFSISSTTVGFVSSLGFSGFFAGLLLAQLLLERRGPKVPVLAGLVAATLGMGIVATAPGLPVLSVGVCLAASSAGFAWTPFNDAVHRKIREVDRPTALSEISTGTSFGIATAGLAAMSMVAAGFSWRVCWSLFTAASAIALALNWVALRGVEKADGDMPQDGWRDLLRGAAIPLYGVAFVLGATSAIFISFAPDHMRAGVDPKGVFSTYAPSLVFVVLGVFGFAGVLAGRMKDAIGLPWPLRLLMLAGAASTALLVIVPGNWTVLIAAAALQGLFIMMTSALLALWSERLFPALPSRSFTAAVLATAVGSVLGPALAGTMSDAVGAKAMFLAVAALPGLGALSLRKRYIMERAGGVRHA
jgi:predicted MFS family arabinose efflux permease